MTKIVGLTGGIGSGKTTLANYVKSLGIPVYIADDAAKEILLLPKTQSSIKLIFGKTIFDNEILNKNKLSEIVFNNPEMLKKLNEIIHPLVKTDFKNWLESNQNNALVLKETAILFECGSYKDCDYIITVVAPISTRIERVMLRDNSTYEAVLSRSENQWSDDMRISKSDYVIENVNIHDACNEINLIFKKILNQ